MPTKKTEGLDLLRVPFPANQISKLPKPTKQQTEDVRNDYKSGIRCDVCGQWHHPKVVHLDYVGHAAITDRLLDVDPNWHWEPLAFGDDGLPLFDATGGLWIKLTVLSMTRYGYGDAEGKKGPAAVKETIGDALRNAAMRFGAALDLWHKGDLHQDVEEETPVMGAHEKALEIQEAMKAAPNLAALGKVFTSNAGHMKAFDDVTRDALIALKDELKAAFQAGENKE